MNNKTTDTKYEDLTILLDLAADNAAEAREILRGRARRKVQLLRELDELRAERDGLRTDKDRLDWIQQYPATFAGLIFRQGWGDTDEDTRMVIDAALREEEKG